MEKDSMEEFAQIYDEIWELRKEEEEEGEDELHAMDFDHHIKGLLSSLCEFMTNSHTSQPLKNMH